MFEKIKKLFSGLDCPLNDNPGCILLSINNKGLESVLSEIDTAEKRIKELEHRVIGLNFENELLKSEQQFGLDLKNINKDYYAGGVVPINCKNPSKCVAAMLLSNMQNENAQLKARVKELEEKLTMPATRILCDALMDENERLKKELEQARIANLSFSKHEAGCQKLKDGLRELLNLE